MRLWRYIRRVLWAVGITCVLLLATVECLYRATPPRMPWVPSGPHGAAVSMILAQVPRAVQPGAGLFQLRQLMPWTILRVLTSILRARKSRSSGPGISEQEKTVPHFVLVERTQGGQPLCRNCAISLRLNGSR